MDAAPKALLRYGCLCLCALLASAETPARADDEAAPATRPPAPGPPAPGPDAIDPNRDAIIPFPVLGGNSDVGLEVGVAGAITRFRDGFFPYRFRLDAVLSTSIKSDERGFRLGQHYETIRFDMPQFLSPRMRLDARVAFWRAVDAPWAGVGNATGLEPRPTPPGTASAYSYVAQTISAAALLRVQTDTPFDVALYSRSRYQFPDVAAGSKLADDLASGAVVGGDPSFLQTLAIGLVHDTRNSEIMPKAGVLYMAGIGGTLGTAERVQFGEGSVSVTHYASFGSTVTFANRLLTSMKFGNVPFYELQQGDVLNPKYLVGGNKGLRGVRLGRYAGLAKVLVNTELRLTPLPRYKVFGWSILPGASALFDTGRVWTAYAARPSTDGRTLGLKWGAGGGLFLEWNQAQVFRIDVTYSPDRSDAPISFYFDSEFIF